MTTNYKEIKLKANYINGIGDAKLFVNDNGNKKMYNLNINLDDILNMKSVEEPIDKRLLKLYKEFKNKNVKSSNQTDLQLDDFKIYNNMYNDQKLEKVPNQVLNQVSNQELEKQNINESIPTIVSTLNNLIDNKLTHISSPLDNEEFLIPKSINKTIRPQSLYRYKNSSKSLKKYFKKNTTTKQKQKQKQKHSKKRNIFSQRNTL
jgi:hypothetical protein